jgi:(p)ppGpp synthase/HD superfamily hydrolase
MQRLEKAIMLATYAHMDQLDKKGFPVILHPLFVMHLVISESEKIVAVLHDVMEDTEITLDIIQCIVDLTPEEAAALVALTHKKGERYTDYIRRVKTAGPLATIVKIADVMHNSSEARLVGLPPEARERLEKKHAAANKILYEGIEDY